MRIRLDFEIVRGDKDGDRKDFFISELIPHVIRLFEKYLGYSSYPAPASSGPRAVPKDS